MTKYHGAVDAFNAILQKVDETLIQAETHLRLLNDDAIEEKTVKSVPENTVIPSPVGSERSCSPNPSSISVSTSSINPVKEKVQVKHKAYIGLDKKKAIVVTSLKAKHEIDEAEVARIEKLIDNLFTNKKKTATSSSSSYIEI